MLSKYSEKETSYGRLAITGIFWWQIGDDDDDDDCYNLADCTAMSFVFVCWHSIWVELGKGSLKKKKRKTKNF